MTPAATTSPSQTIALCELSGRAFAPVISPFPTLLAHVSDAIGNGGHEPPGPLTRAVRRRLHQRDLTALEPLLSGWPREVCPVTPGASFEQELEAVLATDSAALAQKIAIAGAMGRDTDPWQVVRERPRAWLREYAAALARAWPAVEPIWTASTGLLDREVERCSVALARGAVRELVPHLHAGSPIVDDHWHVPSHSADSGRLDLAETIRLAPIVAPPSSDGWSDDDDDRLSSIVYSAPRWWRALGEEQPSPESLEALLGPQRAKLLLGLDSPQAAGELADLLFTVPSAITHHVRALEASGLVARSPHGRRVIISRTSRGTTLLNLYGRCS